MSAFDPGRKRQQADAWVRLAQIHGRRIETFCQARVGDLGRIAVFNDRVGRQVKIRRTIRPERIHLSHELNALQFAPKIQVEEVPQRDPVRCR